MTKRKNVVSKMLLLVLILTLISCCFLGSTFARYTSSGEGTGTLQVAKWDVSIEKEGDVSGDQTTLNFDKLSPAKEAYEGGSSYSAEHVRSHSSGKVLVATIANNGDVSAEVTFTTSDITLEGAGYGTDSAPTEDAVKGLFSIALYLGTDASDTDTTTPLETKTIAKGEKLYIFAQATWTSDDQTVFGAAADERDTWVGKNVTSVSWTISYTAVQATELPNA